MSNEYSFNGKLWKYPGKGGWYFISLPEPLSTNIRQAVGKAESGWGRLSVSVSLGKSSWDTSLWFDRKRGGYLLPVKKTIRDSERLKKGEAYNVGMSIYLPSDDLDFRSFRNKAKNP